MERVASWAGRMSVVAFALWIFSFLLFWRFLFLELSEAVAVSEKTARYSLPVAIGFFIVYVMARVRADKQARRQSGN